MHVVPGADGARCPDCGTDLGSGAGTEGLCPRCLLSLALVASPLDQDSGVGSEVETDAGPDPEAATAVGPTTGRILGERYQMREMLGRGGMGEVWQAYDLKLQVDVALKSIRPERGPARRAGTPPPRGAIGARGDLAERLPDLRPGGRRGARVRVDGVHRRGDAARVASEPRTARACRRPPAIASQFLARARGHSPGRARPPGREAREHHDHAHGARGADGLRGREGDLRKITGGRSPARRPTWRRSRRAARRSTRGRTSSLRASCWPR